MDDLESGLLDKEDTGSDYVREKQGNRGYEVRYGTFSLVRSPMPETYIEAVISAHKSLVSTARTYSGTFQEHRRRLQEIAGPIREELDTLTIKRLVPGKCIYCPI
ncbi:hypothetical protein ACFLXO_08820 [Chloroflexota bacterium]